MSTFTEYKKRTTSRKIVLIEYDQEVLNREMVNIAAGVWYFSPDIDYAGYDETTWMTNFTGRTDVNKIGSVRINGATLIRATSVQNCVDNRNTFYWDSVNRLLYVHEQNHNDPRFYDFFIGVTRGFIVGNSELSPSGRYEYDGLLYENRVVSLPTLTYEKDSNFFGIAKTPSTTFSFDNADGYFNDFRTTYGLYGNELRVIYGYEDLDYSDFLQVYTAFTESHNTNIETFDISLASRKNFLEEKVPINSYTLNDYPDLDPSNIGKEVPFLYGTFYDVPVTCIDEAASGTPTEFTFKMGDTTYHEFHTLTTVYNRSTNTIVTPSSVDLVNGLFVLSSSDYSPGDDITIDGKGYKDSVGALIENPLDIISDLLTILYGWEFSSVYFDLTEWNASKAVAPNIQKLMDKRETLDKIITEIANSTPGVFYIRPDNRFSFKTFSNTRTISTIIDNHEILNDYSINDDLTEGATSVRSGYKKRWFNDDYQYKEDLSRDTELRGEFKVPRSEDFETLISDESGIISYNTNMLDIYGGLFGTTDIDIHLTYPDLEIMDFIDVQLNDRTNKTIYGVQTCEITSVSFNFNDFSMSLGLRLLRDSVNKIKITEDGKMKQTEDDKIKIIEEVI